MPTNKFGDIKEAWHKIGKHAVGDGFPFELEIDQKLMDIFHPGNYYYYIFNCYTKEIEYASPSVTEVLGLIAPSYFKFSQVTSMVHPEDLPYFDDFELRATDFLTKLPPGNAMKYKMAYDFRAKRDDGQFIRLLQESVALQTNEKGLVVRRLIVHTDISHLNKNACPTLSFIGLNGEPSYYDVCRELATPLLEKSIFTKMEQKVLQQLLKGSNSKQIAEAFFISKLTVNGHRRNILKKANCNSTVELILKAAQHNWLGIVWLAHSCFYIFGEASLLFGIA
ncbi:LuxR C-terminal-related transcriptional regulator [Parasediminibacterium sp. JCM 36343]|uniref:LuxR C-terminal-related transcriptional regulator n=1 Tax=Parasediminibacterium sp. JCM 36343 TaxID=3374279 RepID=UPI00397CFE65